MAACDNDCGREATGAVAGPRPSDKTEIVSVLYLCTECAGSDGTSLEDWEGDGMTFATWEAWSSYIESRVASLRRHLFLTI